MSPEWITVHSTATQPLPSIKMNDIRQMHLDRNWSDIGYHFVIETDGSIVVGRPIFRMGAHVKGHNQNNIAIALVGGVDENGDVCLNYTVAQSASLGFLINMLRDMWMIPLSNIKGHRDWYGEDPSTWLKECPCFDVAHFLETGEMVERV